MNQEKKEIDLLLNKGFEIKIRVLGKTRVFHSKILSMGRLLRLSKIFIQMELDEEKLSSEKLEEQIAMQYQAVVKNADRIAEVVATCITDNRFYKWYLKKQILKTYTPKDILEFAQKLLKESDYAPFIASIALMNGSRPTKANPIEKK